jgi:8-oxo-dGTP pyrophosphatase MutT (NUDIX family)
MARLPIPTWYFALIAVRLENRFLLVQESKRGQQWYLPAGRVEPGETLVEAARRETLEEAGISVIIEGILRIEHTPLFVGEQSAARVRVIFASRPQDDTPPKSLPDEESLRAGWFDLEELKSLSLRGEEVREILQYLANGGTIYPLGLITFEGAPWQHS